MCFNGKVECKNVCELSFIEFKQDVYVKKILGVKVPPISTRQAVSLSPFDTRVS